MKTSVALFALLLAGSLLAAEPIVTPPHDLGDFPLLPAVWDQQAPVALSNGDGYLVLYLHQQAPGQLRAARVTETGEILDPFGIGIGTTTHGFDGTTAENDYLVSWVREGCDEYAGFRCLQISAVTADGAVNHLFQLPLVDDPQMAASGDRLFITGTTFENDEWVVRGWLLRRDGTVMAEADILKSSSHAEVVEVTSTNSGFLVVAGINDDYGASRPRQIVAVSVSSEGTAGEVSVIAEGDLFAHSVATISNVTGVVFGEHHRSPSFISLDDKGEPLIEPVSLLTYPDSLLLPAGDLFLMVSRQHGVVLQTLTTNGVPGPAWTLEAEYDRENELTAFAGSPSSLLLLWQERVGDGWSDPGGLNQIVGIYDRALEPLRAPQPLMLSAPVQRRSAVAANASSFLHVWEEYRDGVWQLYSQPVGPDGVPTAWPIDHAHSNYFSVASDGNDFALATERVRWTEQAGFEPFIELTGLASDGTVVSKSDFPFPATAPKIVYDGNRYVLLWNRFENVPERGMLTRLDDALDPIGESLPIGNFVDAVGFDGGVHILELIPGEEGSWDSLATWGIGVRIATTETMTLGPLTVLVEPRSEIPGQSVVDATLASNRHEALVVWTQYENNGDSQLWNYRQRTTLVNMHGNVVSETGGDPTSSRGAPVTTMTWDGRRYVSAGMNYTGDEIVIQYFTRTGAFSDRVEIPVDSYLNATLSVASPGGGHAVLDYSAFVTNELVGIDVERVLTRSITSKPERARPVRR